MDPCSCDEALALKEALRKILAVCTSNDGQWVDVAELCQAALAADVPSSSVSR